MELHERLASLPEADQPERLQDPFAQLKNRIHLGIIEDLGRQIFTEDIDPAEYVFRTSTQIEAAAAHLDWLNKGVFIGVAGRQPGGVIYETYLVE